jgi:hypothetical protein
MPVCLHPAYGRSNELGFFDSTVNKIAAPLAGIPGLPVRAGQSPSGDIGEPLAYISGRPPVLSLPDDIVQGTIIGPPSFAATLDTRIALALVTPVGTRLPENKSCRCQAVVLTTQAQNAVALYLLDQAGFPADSDLIPGDAGVVSAERGLAALAPAARHAWLRDHIVALRSGALTAEELP